MPAVFGYWKLRGLGRSIQLILEYTGTDYTQKLYDFGPAPTYDRSEWLDEKFNLGLDFPNLPYFMDGKYKITQSHAILKHIARKNNLVGETECESVRADVAEHEAMDLRQAWTQFVYGSSEGLDEKKEAYKTETLKCKLEKLSKFLGSQKWFTGDSITYVDFLLYELFDINRIIFTCCLNDFENLKEYMTRFESLDTIKKYMSSSRYSKSPLNGPMAALSGD